MEQLQQRGGFTCSLKTLWRALRQRGLTRKKKTLHADEQDRPDVQTKRRSFRRKVKQIEPERLVFVDETGVTTAMTPAYAWAPRGERAVDSAPGFVGVGDGDRGAGTGRGPRPAGVPGVDRHGGVPDVRGAGAGAGIAPGGCGGVGQPQPHLAPAVAEAIERAGASVLPLPPYSPDYTPIEEMDSKVKEFLRRVAARTKGDLYDAIGRR